MGWDFFKSFNYCPHCKQEFTDMDTVDTRWEGTDFVEECLCFECGKHFTITYVATTVSWNEED